MNKKVWGFLFVFVFITLSVKATSFLPLHISVSTTPIDLREAKKLQTQLESRIHKNKKGRVTVEMNYHAPKKEKTPVAKNEEKHQIEPSEKKKEKTKRTKKEKLTPSTQPTSKPVDSRVENVDKRLSKKLVSDAERILENSRKEKRVLLPKNSDKNLRALPVITNSKKKSPTSRFVYPRHLDDIKPKSFESSLPGSKAAPPPPPPPPPPPAKHH